VESQFITWKGLQAVRLIGGGYEAVVLPEFGANCISLIHQSSGNQLLRVPQTQQLLCKDYNVYGLPLLFPPNRVRDGKFIFEGREYRFPINEPNRGNHLHGFLSQTTFTVIGGGVFLYEATEKNGYLDFPHAFSIQRKYELCDDGLLHTIAVTNRSELNMPVGIGVHATLRVDPLENCQLQIDTLYQWEIDTTRMLPTGERFVNTPLLTALRSGVFNPVAQPISAMLECRPGSEMVLCSVKDRWRCVPDPAFRFIMLWNGGGTDGFVCVEPQSWVTDAPNLPLPSEVTGLRALAPGDTVQFNLRYYYMKE
jgi:aldose 1-epimerase